MRGFTVIEFLVIIAILGLLSTVFIGAFKEEKTAISEQDYCKKYENYYQKDLPAKCIKYYK